jgi:hypothetical protein
LPPLPVSVSLPPLPWIQLRPLSPTSVSAALPPKMWNSSTLLIVSVPPSGSACVPLGPVEVNVDRRRSG